MDDSTRSAWQVGRLAITVAVFAAIWLVPAFAFADVDKWVVGVDGMACPFCAYGIEKKLNGLDGVEEVNIRIKDGEVDVPVSAGATVSPDQLQTAIKEAGFSIRDLVVEGTGTIETEGETIIAFSDGLKLPVADYDGKPGRFKVVGKLTRKGDRWVAKLTSVEDA